MKRLVNEFRDYARLPSAELKPLQLNALISDVLALYASEPHDKVTRAQVQTELDSACPAILGDEQQLRQVIHNLLQNAQDACEPRTCAHRVARAASTGANDCDRHWSWLCPQHPATGL
jgi:nitrogen fixation/metabolism regulation signal transduction histidine kinase